MGYEYVGSVAAVTVAGFGAVGRVLAEVRYSPLLLLGAVALASPTN